MGVSHQDIDTKFGLVFIPRIGTHNVRDAGLLLAAVLAIFGIYYALIKARVITPGPDQNPVGKILNHSFVVVLVLMVGAFGIAAIDKLGPFLKGSPA
jgi:hypothetical protein